MKIVFKFSIISILLTTTINFPSKAEFRKNSKSKVTVTELDDNNNFGTLNTIRIKTPQINKKTPLRFNTSTYSTSRKELLNLIHELNWKYGFFRSDIGYKVIDE